VILYRSPSVPAWITWVITPDDSDSDPDNTVDDASSPAESTAVTVQDAAVSVASDSMTAEKSTDTGYFSDGCLVNVCGLYRLSLAGYLTNNSAIIF
jgi:hypothetical protein